MNEPGEREKAQYDQVTALVGDTYPPLWSRLYKNCLEQGFSQMESFRLVQTYILSQAPHGIRGDDG